MSAQEVNNRADRLGGLRRFAVAITVLNILGHTFFGFEQSLAQPLVALVSAYSAELLLEFIDARFNRRALRFMGGGVRKFIEFLLSAHITGLACAMLLYANDRLGPVAFASVVAICSKCILRAPAGAGTRHFFNPSNFGITVTLLVFAWVSVAPPYQFTENMTGPRLDLARRHRLLRNVLERALHSPATTHCGVARRLCSASRLEKSVS